jgi:hypothetical protein
MVKHYIRINADPGGRFFGSAILLGVVLGVALISAGLQQSREAGQTVTGRFR